MKRNNSVQKPLADGKPDWQRYLEIALDAILLFVVGFVLTSFRLSFDNKIWQVGISVIYYYAFISFYLRAKDKLGKIGGLLVMILIMGLVVFLVNSMGYFPVAQETVKP